VPAERCEVLRTGASAGSAAVTSLRVASNSCRSDQGSVGHGGQPGAVQLLMFAR
jgi:hypothetical protein